MLLAHLPRDSATVLETSGEAARWDDAEHLLATTVDVLSELTWLFAKANFKGRHDRPRPLHRPGTPDTTVRIGGKRSYTVAELHEIFARMSPKSDSEEVTDGD